MKLHQRPRQMRSRSLLRIKQNWNVSGHSARTQPLQPEVTFNATRPPSASPSIKRPPAEPLGLFRRRSVRHTRNRHIHACIHSYIHRFIRAWIDTVIHASIHAHTHLYVCRSVSEPTKTLPGACSKPRCAADATPSARTHARTVRQCACAYIARANTRCRKLTHATARSTTKRPTMRKRPAQSAPRMPTPRMRTR
jgi:hypothetical protein